MKIALIGYGKMGRMIEQEALRRGHDIVAVMSRDIDLAKLASAEVCIDFSHPEAAVGNVRALADAGKSVVIGTTGWYEHLDAVKRVVEEAQIGVVYGPNFSIGVNLFLKLVAAAGDIMKGFSEYHAAIHEEHHRKKVDSPSGTALAIGDVLRQHCSNLADDPIAISSLRCGSIPGTHTVVFDSDVDTISLTHTARSRTGFALGAVVAAEWLVGKRGLHRFVDIVDGSGRWTWT